MGQARRRCSAGFGFAVALAAAPASAGEFGPYAWTELKPGTDQYFVRIGGFLPLWAREGSLVWVDARATLGEDLYYTGDVGLGVRRVLGERWVGGAFAFYDRLTSSHTNTYHQMTAGLELLGEEWDFRLNGYLPFTGKQALGLAYEPSGTPPRIEGNHIVVDSPYVETYEAALRGVELEVGRVVPLPEFLPETRAYAAGYAFGAPRSSGANGFRVRLESRVSDRYSVGTSYQWDDLFGSQGFLELEMRFGSGRTAPQPASSPSPQPPVSAPAPSNVARRLAERARFEVEMMVDDSLRPERLPPELLQTVGANGSLEPITIWFVNNLAAPGGDGSFLRPFDTLVEAEDAAQPSHWIFVYAGDGTTRAQDAGISLQDRQRLLGQGVPLLVQGTTLVPAAEAPLLSNTGGPVVLLANGNEVAGIHTIGGEGGIFGVGSIGFDLHDNIVEGTLNGEPGIGILDGAGTGSIARNVVVGGSSDGIAAYSLGSSALSLQVSSNLVSGNTDNGIGAVVVGDGRIDLAAHGNTVIGNGGVGILGASMANGTVTVDFVSNFVDAAGESGIGAVAFGPGFISGQIASNVVSNGGEVGIAVGSLGGGNVNVPVLGNRLESNQSEGVLLISQGGAQVSSLVQGNTFVDSVDAGLRAVASDTSQIVTSILSNRFQGSAGVGVNVSGSAFVPGAASDITATIAGNVFEDTAENAIQVVTCGPGNTCTSTIDATIQQNTVDGFGSQAIAATAVGGGTVNATIDGNSVANSVGPPASGIAVGAYGGPGSSAAFSGTVSNNTVSGVGDRGIQVESLGPAMVSAVVDGNTVSGTGGNSIAVSAMNGGVITRVDVTDNVASGANNQGIAVGASDSAVIQSAHVDGNTVTQSLWEGIGVRVADTATVDAHVTGNVLSNNNLSGTATGGFVGVTTGASSLCLDLSGNDNTQSYALLNPAAGPLFRAENSLGTNVGPVNQFGAITIVPVGTCAP